MKTMKVLIALVVFFTFALSAEHYEREIIRLINEVKKAPPEDRYKVMNRLKLRLRELGRREREEMIRKVYEELRGEREEGHHERFEEEREYRGAGEEREEHMEAGKEDKVFEKIEDKKEDEDEKDHDHDEYFKKPH
jgi:hypothetical protein